MYLFIQQSGLRQCGGSEITQSSKRQQVDSKPGRTDRESDVQPVVLMRTTRPSVYATTKRVKLPWWALSRRVLSCLRNIHVTISRRMSYTRNVKFLLEGGFLY